MQHPSDSDTPRDPESPTQRLDRLVHAAGATLTGGLSPISLALATADWAWHLGVSPGRQMELAALAVRLTADTLRPEKNENPDAGEQDQDPRYRHAAWATWPFSQLRSGFRNAEIFWREASQMPGMTAHHSALTAFFAKQWLAALAPANWLATNPVVLQDVVDSQGSHLRAGLQHWLADTLHLPEPPSPTLAPQHRVGQEVAVTPGQVVYRNHLVELLRYTPQTERVHPEPVFIIPSWIMKFYILDLSPHNSLVRYLVSQGHTVYMLSWRNPGAEDAELSMDDYVRMGVLDALKAIGSLHRPKADVHAMGYCLGGTLLAATAALLAQKPAATEHHLPELKTLTLLAAQTDFSEPGELGLFIDESQIGLLDNITKGQGFLSGRQMAGSFQFLHSRDLVWTRQMREYLMGEREQPSDLMAWNADTTRMPARMHYEYLTALYLHNALATSRYQVLGRTVSLRDIRQPVFLVGTQRDHISPWRSVYKLHHLCDADITFVLTHGGHNAGIISEPGHPGRDYLLARRAAHGPGIDPDHWLATAKRHEGSWWPAWHRWLSGHSGAQRPVVALPPKTAQGKAPGHYVMVRYAE